jgi:hypothetical protein
MGVAVGDADNDGFLDIVVTNFSEDFSTMYRGDGGGFFDDVSSATGVGESTYASLSWGTTLADLDNDGDQDLVIANGHIYPQVDTHPEFELTYAQRNQLLENDGTGQFRDVTDRAGPGFAQLRSSRGLAAGDYDNDGDLDLLVTHLDEPPSLLRNDSGGGAWLAVALEAPPGDGTVIGAEVRLRIGDRTLIRDRASGGSFLSVHDPRLHFGLGQATRIDALVVRWPDGNRTELRDLGVDQLITVRK